MFKKKNQFKEVHADFDDIKDMKVTLNFTGEQFVVLQNMVAEFVSDPKKVNELIEQTSLRAVGSTLDIISRENEKIARKIGAYDEFELLTQRKTMNDLRGGK